MVTGNQRRCLIETVPLIREKHLTSVTWKGRSQRNKRTNTILICLWSFPGKTQREAKFQDEVCGCSPTTLASQVQSRLEMGDEWIWRRNEDYSTQISIMVIIIIILVNLTQNLLCILYSVCYSIYASFIQSYI